MKILAFTTKMLTVLFLLMSVVFVAMAQGKVEGETLTLLQILPAVTFVFALFTGGISLYTVSQMRKLKDEIMGIFRAEIKNAINDLENRNEAKELEGRELNKERLSNFKESMEFRLNAILDKVNDLVKNK